MLDGGGLVKNILEPSLQAEHAPPTREHTTIIINPPTTYLHQRLLTLTIGPFTPASHSVGID